MLFDFSLLDTDRIRPLSAFDACGFTLSGWPLSMPPSYRSDDRLGGIEGKRSDRESIPLWSSAPSSSLGLCIEGEQPSERPSDGVPIEYISYPPRFIWNLTWSLNFL